MTGWHFWIDRFGTFTDTVAHNAANTGAAGGGFGHS